MGESVGGVEDRVPVFAAGSGHETSSMQQFAKRHLRHAAHEWTAFAERLKPSNALSW